MAKQIIREIRKPDYRGDGVAVWKNTDKNGKEYLAVKILNSMTVAAFAPKAEEKGAPVAPISK